jgi:hypothetical protein
VSPAWFTPTTSPAAGTPEQDSAVHIEPSARSTARLRQLVLGISAAEATFARRGFGRGADPRARQQLERSGLAFLAGYHEALADADPKRLARRLETLDVELRGFGFEGAAMALALLDHLMPWGSGRLTAFLRGPGRAHVYIVHVGAGWAIARLPWLRRRVERPLASMDPLLRWLAIDGYGFHEGYFDWPRSVTLRQRPRHLDGYALRAFDQGLGRSLWFYAGADVPVIARTVEGFEAARRADLWSGIGLACAYAGGVDQGAVARLRSAARGYLPELAQGVAFAAKARAHAGNTVAHTKMACALLCEMSVSEAAAVTDAALLGLPADGEVPAYETWRQRIHHAFARLEITG